jgi:hypothetical protein
VVDCVRKPASRAVAVERRCDLRYADGEWDRNVYSGGDGQRISGADSLGAGVDRCECSAGDVDDYNNEPGCGEGWNLLQRDLECEWRHAWLYVVGEWKPARRIEHVGRGCDLGNANVNGYVHVHSHGI